MRDPPSGPPGYPGWRELSRAIVAFGGSLEGFHADLPPLGLEWWENPGVIPGMVYRSHRQARRVAAAAGCCERSAAGAESRAS